MDNNDPAIPADMVPVPKRLRYQSTVIANPLLIQSLQKISHLLSPAVKAKYGIESRNEESKSNDLDQPSTSTSTYVPQLNGLDLMELNDDCLLHLFTFLPPMTVANVAHVNVRLNKLIKRFIQTKYKIYFSQNFNLVAHNQTIPINLFVLQSFLYIFGQDIGTLTLNRNIFDETYDKFESMGKIQNLIDIYCPKMKEMTLIGFGMCGLTHKFYGRLESLTLDDCSVTRAWINMPKLTVLKLSTVIFRRWPMEYVSRENRDWDFYQPPKPIPLPCNRFGQLKELRLIDVNLDNPAAEKLLKSNSNHLQKLSIVKCREISPFIFGAVGKLSHLVEFEYKKKNLGNSSFLPLLSLKKLKVLKLFHSSISIPDLVDCFITNRIKIEHLELGLSAFTAKAAESIQKMSTIKVLKLIEMNGLNESHILSMAGQLRELEELHINSKAFFTQNGIADIVRAASRLVCLKIDAPGFILNVEMYQTILTAIQERENPNKLEITIIGDVKQVFVPNDVLNGQNEEWVIVKEFNRQEHSLDEDLNSKIGPPPPPPSRYYSDSDEDSDYDYY